MKASKNEQAIRTFLKGLAAPDARTISSALADDAVFVFPRPSLTGTVIRGGARIGEFLEDLTRKTYARTHWNYGPIIATERHGVAEWELTGDLVSGEAYGQFYCFTFDFSEGKIIEIREYIDTAYGMRVAGEQGGKVVQAYAER